MCKQYLDEFEEYYKEKAYLLAEDEYEEWVFWREQEKYDQNQKETKIKVVYGKEQLKEK